MKVNFNQYSEDKTFMPDTFAAYVKAVLYAPTEGALSVGEYLDRRDLVERIVNNPGICEISHKEKELIMTEIIRVVRQVVIITEFYELFKKGEAVK